jgi:hypothetical protein
MRARLALAVLITGTALLAGCTSGVPRAAAPTPSAAGSGVVAARPGSPVTDPGSANAGAAAQAGAGSGSGRHGGRAASQPTLPPGWPAALPAPPGSIQGANSAPGVSVVTTLFNGDSDQARRSVIDRYRPYGFTPDPDARIPTILTGAGYTITVHLAPRDHSAAETNVVVQVRTAS